MEKEVVIALITGASVASVSIASAIIQFMTTKLKYREELARQEREYELQLKKGRYKRAGARGADLLRKSATSPSFSIPLYRPS
jgi:hypothetical protein